MTPVIGTVGVAERNVYTDFPNVIVVPANTATLILIDESKTNGEISRRLIQNVGTNVCYYSENLVNLNGELNNRAPTPYCDATKLFHGQLAAGQQLDCTDHRQAICVFSVAGTTISTTVRRRTQGQSSLKLSGASI